MQAVCKHGAMCSTAHGFDYQVVRKGNCKSSCFFNILNPDYGQVLVFWNLSRGRKTDFTVTMDIAFMMRNDMSKLV